MSTPRIDVAVHFPAIGRSIEPAQLRVLVEDTSAVDAPAISFLNWCSTPPKLDLSTPMVLTFQLPYTGNAADLTVSAYLRPTGSSSSASSRRFDNHHGRAGSGGEPCHVYLVEY